MTLLIASHAEAHDIWPVTAHFLTKHWPDGCKIFLGANGVDRSACVPGGWDYINEGEDLSFSKSLLDYLGHVETDYLILMLDDFAILEDVDPRKIQKAFRFLRERNGVYLRLVPNPPGTRRIDSDFSRIEVEKNVPYITSLQMALWKKEFLMELLHYDFSPWDFETKAGRTDAARRHQDGFYVTNEPWVRYTHFVEKGKFYPLLKKLLEEEKIPLRSDRPFWREEEIKKMREPFFKSRLRALVPPRYYNILRKLLGKAPL